MTQSLHLVKHRVHWHLELDKYPLQSILKGTHSLRKMLKRVLEDTNI